MHVNPIIYYEVLLNSPIDKVFEYNDIVIYYNILIPGPMGGRGEAIVVKVIKKGSVAAMFINDVDEGVWEFEEELKNKYNF